MDIISWVLAMIVVLTAILTKALGNLISSKDDCINMDPFRVGSAERKNEQRLKINTVLHGKKHLSDRSTQIQIKSFANALAQRADPELKKEFIQKFVEAMTASTENPAEACVTLDDIPDKIKYTPSMKFFRTTTHIGQRKLFLSELQFLNDVVREVKNSADPTQTPIVVYAGAAPGDHDGYLSDLFPRVKFILVDPNPFKIVGANPVYLRRTTDAVGYDEAVPMLKRAIEGKDRIYIIAGLFTNDLAKAIHDTIKLPTYFISDIRTNVTDGQSFPDTADIMWNSAQQFNWIVAMKPIKSMLKFRHPFYEESSEIMENTLKIPYIAAEFELAKKNGIDFIENARRKHLVFFSGEVRIQAFAGNSSTETRLVTDGKNIVDWGTPSEYEDKFFYFNAITRPYVRHRNPNVDFNLGFDYCNDCALENKFWEDYLENTPGDTLNCVARVIRAKGPAPTVRELVAHLSRITSRSLIRGDHGRDMTWADLIQSVREYHNREPEKPRQFVITRFKDYACDPNDEECLAQLENESADDDQNNPKE